MMMGEAGHKAKTGAGVFAGCALLGGNAFLQPVLPKCALLAPPRFAPGELLDDPPSEGEAQRPSKAARVDGPLSRVGMIAPLTDQQEDRRLADADARREKALTGWASILESLGGHSPLHSRLTLEGKL